MHQALQRLEAAERHARDVIDYIAGGGTVLPEPWLSRIEAGRWTIAVATDGAGSYVYVACARGRPWRYLLSRDEALRTIQDAYFLQETTEASHAEA